MKKPPRNHARAADQTQINVSVPAELKTELQRIAYSEDMSTSQLVRKILREKGPEYGIDPEKTR
jgi:metal-responsive CopG/Arc/MetJ family transcriptional regulator